MGRKIIDKDRFSWEDEGSFRLDYKTIFEEKKAAAGPPAPDMDRIMEARLREWNEKLEAARRQSFDQGYRKGLEEGREQAGRELDQRLEGLREHFRDAAAEWKATMELLKPGLLNLVFDLAETILEVPVTNGTMRNKLERELNDLLQDIEMETRPVLWVSRDDFAMVQGLAERYEGTTGVIVRVGNTCKPGEYQLETSRERIVRDFGKMLSDFKESLILPHS
jgi:flagellar biosynthesis/type III secretory pathway protein FliH